MFQFLRRVSGSLFPRPDRPWRDDATSHAPTIGCKRRHSVIEQDDDDPAFTAKKTKSVPVKSDTEPESASERESPGGDVVSPVEAQKVKEITGGVEKVDLGNEDEVEDVSSIRPEGVPLPDSPSGSPEPERKAPGPAEPDAAQEDTDDKDSSAPEDDVDEEAEAEPVTPNSDTSAEIPLVTAGSGAQDVPEVLEVKA